MLNHYYVKDHKSIDGNLILFDFLALFSTSHACYYQPNYNNHLYKSTIDYDTC